MKEFYHVTSKEKEDSILSEGLIATDAPECPKNEGIHVSETVMGAHAWIGQLRNEREEFDRTFVIFSVKVKDDITVKDDEFVGVGPDDAYVLCIESINPENVDAVEWVY